MQVLRIVLVSPSDVANEREIVKSVVNDVNTTCGRFFNILLELHRWEDVPPGLHEHGAQGQIDHYLGIERADLVIGVFWRRFGTAITAGGETGSEHEIRNAYRSWSSSSRPNIMLYFNRAGVSHESSAEMAQAIGVNKFREDFQPHGLVKEYVDVSDFAIKIRNDLTTIVSQTAAARVRPGNIPCAMTVIPKTIRAEGVTELLGEVRFSFARQPHLETMEIDIEVLLNTNITNGIDSHGEATDAILLVEPDQSTSNAREVIRGRVTRLNGLRFASVTLRPKGTEGVVQIRALGIRANASLLGATAPVMMFAKIESTNGPNVSILNPQATVGNCYPSLMFGVANPRLFRQEVGANPEFAVGRSSSLEVDIEWTFSETFPFAFKNRLEESVTGTYGGTITEPALIPHRGTLLGIMFQGIPDGVRLYVTLSNFTETYEKPSIRLAREPSDTGHVRSDKGDMALIPVNGSIAFAVWEWIGDNRPSPWVASHVTVGFAVVAAPGRAARGVVAASANFCPLSTSPTASGVAPVPRFVQPYTSMNVFAFHPDPTSEAGLG